MKQFNYQAFLKVCLVFLSLLLSFQVTMAQTSKKVDIVVHNVSLHHFFEMIEKKYGVQVTFRDVILEGKEPVTSNSKSILLEQILEEVLPPRGLKHTVIDNTIVVTNREVAEKKPSRIPRNGIVYDEKGETLIGVNVILKEEKIGTVTDINGEFTIEAAEGEILIISYIGYNPQEIRIGKGTKVNITLKEKDQILDEVVVVGYGKQKKLNLTGAIDIISSEKLESMSVSNITQALQGTVPGLIISDGGGKPGTALSLNIRGTGTMGNTEPLIVIDGIPAGTGEFNTLNPRDIESISVLKDASSAAIYGSRGANGVLVVTTKKGRKDMKPTINVSYSHSLQTPTKVPQMLDSWDYAILRNEALTNSNKAPEFTDEQIAMMRDGSNPDYYANVNWWKEAVKPNSSMQVVNISIMGGSTNSTYAISGGYTKQDGLVGYTDFDKFNTRIAASTQITDRIEASGSIAFYRDNSQTPYNYSRFFSEVLNMSPYIPIRKENGDWGHLNNETTNPVAWITEGGYRKTQDDNVLLSGTVGWEIIDGLKWQVQGGYNHWTPGHTEISKTIEFVNEDGSITKANYPNGTSRQFVKRTLRVLQTQLDYEKQIKENQIHLLAGFSDENYISSWVGGWRHFIPDNNMSEIDGATGSGDSQGAWGSSEEWQMRSYFGRVNYNFASRYFAEANFRYDGSSRLAPGHHYTFFPSGSLGWRISEEKFMDFSRKYISNIKIRTSYGQLGNQTIDLYQYAEVINTDSKDYMFGHEWVAGSYINKVPNSSLQWEKSTIFNVGLDMNAFDNRLSFAFDWYKKKTNGILLSIPVSSVIGLPVSVQNAGKMSNHGWELQIGWRDKMKDLSYGVNFVLSDQQNKVIDLKGTGPFIGDRTITQEGYALNTLYAYIADGYYTSDEDIANSPKFEGYANQIKVGDIKYKDISGPDGVPDGIIDSYDRQYVGWSAPRYMFGLDITAEYKGFDLRAFLQGVGKRDEFVHGQIIYMSGGFKHIQDERWKADRTVEENLKHAKYPRITDGEGNNYEISTYWLRNAAYCRLKNLQVGYTLPKKVTHKISMENIRVYFSGNNLFTITSFPYIDPEGSSSGAYYPQLKTFSFGIDITIGKK